MATEIERKFLVDTAKWASISKSIQVKMKQGYLVSLPDKTIRVRIAEEKAYLTIKGKSKNISRPEFEYEIPVSDAYELLTIMGGNMVEKIRHYIVFDNCTWEVDVFEGDNKGLIVAEIELKSEDQIFNFPEWIAKEVTDDKRYTNSNLAIKPYGEWM